MDEGPSPLMIVVILLICIIALAAIFAAIKVFLLPAQHQCAIVAGNLPDPLCTPGAVFPDATVAQICTKGYSASVRDVSTDTKRQVFAMYNLPYEDRAQYEVDHLISLELGGSNDIKNLWPEPEEPRPGAFEKDRIENYLHRELCAGRMNLTQVQAIIARNWTVMLNAT